MEKETTILEAWDYITDNFLKKIRKDMINYPKEQKPNGLLININKFNKEQLDSIYFFDGMIKKLLKYNNIIYYNKENNLYWSRSEDKLLYWDITEKGSIKIMDEIEEFFK